jgi:hypothetical protein
MLLDMTCSSPARMGPARARWSIIALFWLLQAATAIFVWPWIFLGEPLPDAEDLSEWALSWAVVLGSIMALQVAMVLPASRPALRPAGCGGRLLRCLVGGIAIGVLVGWAFLATRWVWIDIWNGPEVESWPMLLIIWPWPVLLSVAVVGPIAAAVLWRASRRGMPVLLSIIIAGAVAAMLVGGVVGGGFALVRLLAGEREWWDCGLHAALATIIASWLIATPLIAIYTRRWRGLDPAARVYRLCVLLFRGTIVEVAALIPLDVMIRRKSDCYCDEGTFWALTWCWAAGLVVLGPVVFLLPARRQSRRLMRNACMHCGYDMGPTPQLERCPECGHLRWRDGCDS